MRWKCLCIILRATLFIYCCHMPWAVTSIDCFENNCSSWSSSNSSNSSSSSSGSSSSNSGSSSSNSRKRTGHLTGRRCCEMGIRFSIRNGTGTGIKGCNGDWDKGTNHPPQLLQHTITKKVRRNLKVEKRQDT